MASLKDRFTKILLERELLTQDQLNEALSVLQKKGGSLQKILLECNMVSEDDLIAALSQGMGVPPISLSRLKLDSSLKSLVPREIAKHYQVVPVSCMGQTLTVAMADPLNVFALDTLTTMTGLSLNALLASTTEIGEAIDRLYGVGVEETLREMAQKAESDSVEFVEASREQETSAEVLLRRTEDAPVVKFTDSLLTKAIRMSASDLLIEPREKTVRVRYRVDGVLQEGEAPPKNLHEPIVSRIKVMAELNIAEHRIPQDGHFKFKSDGRLIDFRVSIMPATFGGNVCLRVLDKQAIKLDIDTLGFRRDDLDKIKECVREPHGMLLSTGPAGSGKTTTLYSLIKLIDAPQSNIVTVEDPVEFELAGINQVNVRPEINLTFASALRSILRQDPDIIMVGEIRDAETADMAVKSALTGHLVLSTLHTNRAAGAIVRLTNMGLEPFLVNSCLMASIGQRLVRKICSKCQERYKPAKGIASKLGLLDERGDPLELVRGRGCRRCFKSGYMGREVIAETLIMTPEIRELVLKRATERDIEQVAIRQGMMTLRGHGIEKVKKHVTTLEEVFRTTVGEAVE